MLAPASPRRAPRWAFAGLTGFVTLLALARAVALGAAPDVALVVTLR